MDSAEAELERLLGKLINNTQAARRLLQSVEKGNSPGAGAALENARKLLEALPSLLSRAHSASKNLQDKPAQISVAQTLASLGMAAESLEQSLKEICKRHLFASAASASMGFPAKNRQPGGKGATGDRPQRFLH